MAEDLSILFEALSAAGYLWSPLTPDRLLAARKNPSSFRPLVQRFGLGLPVADELLEGDGLPHDALEALRRTGLIVVSTVTGLDERTLFVPHDPWPPHAGAEAEYVHLAEESETLLRACAETPTLFVGKRVLDLGSSSGVLALGLAGVAKEVAAIDICARAVEFGTAAAIANGYTNINFMCGAIGEIDPKPWKGFDVAVFNPPMVVPETSSAQPHRDGGRLGVELPLAFLDFSEQALIAGGAVICLATNPIVEGKGVLFDALAERPWKDIGSQRLHPHFNQNVARKRGYKELGIERIELWMLRLSLKT